MDPQTYTLSLTNTHTLGGIGLVKISLTSNANVRLPYNARFDYHRMLDSITIYQLTEKSYKK